MVLVLRHQSVDGRRWFTALESGSLISSFALHPISAPFFRGVTAGNRNAASASKPAGRSNAPMTLILQSGRGTLLLQSRRGTICAREKLACRAGELKEFVLLVEQTVYAHRVPDSRKKKGPCSLFIQIPDYLTERPGLYQKCDAAQPICDRCSAAGIGYECFYKERLSHKSPTLKDVATLFLDTPQIPSPTLSATSTACSPSPSSSSRQYTFPVTTTGLPFSVTAGGSNSVTSTSTLDIDQENVQIPDASLDDLNTSL